MGGPELPKPCLTKGRERVQPEKQSTQLAKPKAGATPERPLMPWPLQNFWHHPLQGSLSLSSPGPQPPHGGRLRAIFRVSQLTRVLAGWELAPGKSAEASTCWLGLWIEFSLFCVRNLWVESHTPFSLMGNAWPDASRFWHVLLLRPVEPAATPVCKKMPSCLWETGQVEGHLGSFATWGLQATS